MSIQTMKYFKPDSTAHRYRITRPGAKYTRFEKVGEKVEAVMYGGPDARNPQLRNEVVLNAAGAEALAFMKLVPLIGTRAPAVVIDTPTESVASDDPSHDAPAEVVIPNQWHKLSAAKRKELASQILGSPVEKVKDADALIEEYIRGLQSNSR